MPPDDRTDRRVLRWNVPVDDAWHEIGGGSVLHVAVREDPALVEVWTLERLKPNWPASDVTAKRAVRAFGTGHLLPPDLGRHLGTALCPTARLVWHVFEAPDHITKEDVVALP